MPAFNYSPENSLDIIKPFAEQVVLQGDVQLMGGIGTAALGHDEVEINFDAKEVRVPETLFLPSYREDGTKRDIDVLVVSSNPERVATVAKQLNDSVGEALEQSVFDIRTHDTLQKQLAHPLGFRAFRTFLSDRYEASSQPSGTYVKSLFPFVVPLPAEAMETWALYVGDDLNPLPIPHPGTTLSNYTSRSISGLRPRDTQKITQVADNVFKKAPAVKEWLIDGPGASQLELSKVLASLNAPGVKNVSLIDGLRVDTYQQSELAEHPAFMYAHEPAARRRLILGEAAFKARALHFFESNPQVVTAWRKVMERRADSIVKNN